MSRRYYHSADGIDLYLGDAREVVPTLKLARDYDVCVTDPVWPDAPPGMFPHVPDPAATFAAVAGWLPNLVRRLVVVLGFRSDPRFLLGVPAALPFLRVAHLRYALPSYQGTLLNGGPVAYVFGDSRPGPGRKVLPGECTAVRPNWYRREGHPCPRHPAHTAWLVEHYTAPGDVVLDPFCGAGSTLLAAYHQGRRAVGVEVVEEYAEQAAKALDAARAQGRLFPAPSPAVAQQTEFAMSTLRGAEGDS